MRRALQLAARGQGAVEPNPMVGCVIVRAGRVLAEGYHRRFGGPHAEIEALRRCDDARGATVYVSLEPCCYAGKTPPCTEALIAAGVARVVAAVRDPNPRVRGQGLSQLRKAGIQTEVGLLADEAAALNAPFFKLMRQGRPWVILKWSQSIDGKIATRRGQSQWISDEAMRAHAHKIRGRVDAIIVGWRTVTTDDPLLTCRLARPRRIAARIVLDSRLRTPLGARLVQTARRVPTWFFCTPVASARRRKRLEGAGCRVFTVPSAGRAGGVSLPSVLDLLGEQQLTNVLVEGGGRVLGSFFDQELADEVHVYVSPRLIGGACALGPLHGRGIAELRQTPLLTKRLQWRKLGTGWFFCARIRPN